MAAKVTDYTSSCGIGRVVERRRAVALACYYREVEGLLIRQIADRLGRSLTTVRADLVAARAVAAQRAEGLASETPLAALAFGRESIPLPKPRESAAISEVLRGGEPTPEASDLQVLCESDPDFAHDSGR